jgi:hypothetical protein
LLEACVLGNRAAEKQFGPRTLVSRHRSLTVAARKGLSGDHVGRGFSGRSQAKWQAEPPAPQKPKPVVTTYRNPQQADKERPALHEEVQANGLLHILLLTCAMKLLQ